MRMRLLVPLLFCSSLLGMERGTTESLYDRHVVFDHAVPAPSYFQSGGMVTPPSAIDLVGGEIPLDPGHYRVPAICLRLTWTSATGGDWRTTLKTRAHYGLVNN